MLRNSLSRPAIMAVVAGLAASPALAQSFTGLGDLPGGTFDSEAWGVSADGSTVVGASIIAGNALFGTTFGAFRWTAATGMVDIYDLGFIIGSVCRAYGVSADGSVVVGAAAHGTLSPTYTNAFVWTQATGTIEVGDLPGGASGQNDGVGRGVSTDGLVMAGSGESDNGPEAFRYDITAQTFLGLGDLPGGTFASYGYGISGNGQVIVGSSVTDNGTIAFYWTQAGGMVSLGSLGVPQGVTPFSEAYGANADGSVIVGLSRSPLSGGSGWEAFRWTQAGGMVGLGDLPGGAVLSEGYATTPDGSIVVGKGGVLGNCGPFGCTTAAHAFIWDAVNGMRDLNTLLPSLGIDIGGWTLSEARGISANGRVIVGTGIDPQTNTQAWRVDLGPVPCYANCDSSTTNPVLNANDFQCFLNKYAAGDPYANCDHSTVPPTLNANDFACFLNAYAAGCP
jgi:probable HAF family extracellular repeat protein